MFEDLGKGAFCKVKRATIKFDDMEEPEEYALKIYDKNKLKNQYRYAMNELGAIERTDFLKLVENEVNIWQNVEHYNVVMIFDYIDDEDSQYMYVVMMYCDYGVLLDFDEKTL